MSPAPSNVRRSLYTGEEYRMIDPEGLGGEAATAIHTPESLNMAVWNCGGVAVFGAKKGDHMVILSPVHFGHPRGSTRIGPAKATGRRCDAADVTKKGGEQETEVWERQEN